MDQSTFFGLCECGCGRPTSIAKKSNAQLGHIKGQPLRFARGHNRRRKAGSAASRNYELPYRTLLTELALRPESRAWVYVLWNADREALYVGKVVRFHYMGRLDEHSHKSSWWGEVAFYSVEEVPVPDVEEAEFQAIRKLQPKHNTAKTAKCGTLSGYKLHAARKEEQCPACREAGNAHARNKRREKGIGPPPQAQCGTYAGYFAHLSREETPCDPCREANTQYARTRRRANGARPDEKASAAMKAHWSVTREGKREESASYDSPQSRVADHPCRPGP